MSLNDETAFILKNGTLIGLSIMVIGLILGSFDFSEKILAIGVLALIFTPFIGVLVSTKCLIQEKDRTWSGIALVLVITLVFGMVVSYFA